MGESMNNEERQRLESMAQRIMAVVNALEENEPENFTTDDLQDLANILKSIAGSMTDLSQDQSA
jgi:hypothetical protein